MGDQSQTIGDGADSPTLRAALELAEVWGARIALAHWLAGSLCSCGNADCASPAKHPIGANWDELASSDPSVLRARLARMPLANIGIATGSGSGLVVLDVDGELGEASLAKYPPLPAAPEVVTARGRHIYLRPPVGVTLHNRAGASGRGFGVKLDFRGEGGFVICPPSRHESGTLYDWRAGRTPLDIDPPLTDDWIVERTADKPRMAASSSSSSTMAAAAASIDFAPLLDSLVTGNRAERWAQAALEREVSIVRGAAEGERNRLLNTAAFNLGTLVAGARLDGGEVKRALLAAAQQNGLSEFEAAKTIRSGFDAGFKKDARSGPLRELTKPGYTGGAHTTTLGRSDAELDAEQHERAAAVSVAESSRGNGFEPRKTTDEIFAELPEQRWAVPGLQIGPGRPTLFVGFGASAKTLAAQSLALSLAAGVPAWGHFDCTPATVLHLDFEQGFYATAKRYQRLALGHAIAPSSLERRLVYVETPTVYLDSNGAEEAYLRACDGYDVVIIDALRGAAPRGDENDSSFRAVLDVLTRVSSRTGTSFIVLHHASKPRVEKGVTADARTLARGSGAIFDAAGCVFNFVAQPGGGGRLVQQVKAPAEGSGGALELFELLVDDIAIGDMRDAGVRVSWQKPVPVDEAAAAAARFERDAAVVLAAVRARFAGGTSNQITAKLGLARARALEVLRALADDGQLEVANGPRRSKVYRIAPASQVKP